ncbi:calnexin, partial [Ascoidea rubescens DSM 1968]
IDFGLSEDSFLETFQDKEWKKRWTVSHARRDGEFTYVGKWDVEEPSIYAGFKNDKGLVVKSPAAHHAISTIFDKPFNNKDNTLVLQYEVKLQKGLSCGGAYIKLLSNSQELKENHFSNETPYQVMFGPDKCGTTNKVHLIIKRKDPVTGEYEEKHLKTPPMIRNVKVSTLYTLILDENQNYEIRINGDVAKAGSLTDENTFSPKLNPEKEIDDVNDVKPEDWDDEEEIPDPDQTEKPEDWDETQPKLIPDPKAKKPKNWDEDAPNHITDPDAKVPEDWDEEEDGEWIAPEIPNPVCQKHGCGKWEAPQIPNPEYKGKWRQPLITNVNYQGEWKPRKIPNPDYYEDSKPADLEEIGGIGFELWTMDNDILFDNIYLGHSIREAEFVGNTTFVPKLDIEEQESSANAPKAPKSPSKP